MTLPRFSNFLSSIFLCFCIGFMATFAISTQIKVVTENFPPFHYLVDNELQGTVIDLMTPALKEFDMRVSDIEVYPWARAYQIGELEPNTLLFSVVRFPAREDLFKWVAPVGYIQVGIFKLKNRTDIHITKTSDIEKYTSAVFIDSAIHHFFKQESFNNFELVGESDSLTHMLMRGRVDIIPASSHGFLSRAAAMGYDINEIELVYYIKELEKGLWTVFNNQTDDDLVLKMKLAIQKASNNKTVIALPLKGVSSEIK
ncbi:substrate-binding periplasmic protein [Marinicellulosiphila megalodicopiae]|uniref:substrate-binding periplasmic protein n=1 Tax=Marinicellulosiphila megalodicopiae TaxID=2724896 RepID=UPI003BB05C47